MAVVPEEFGEVEFDAWVRGRLADWTASEIRAFERWLVTESQFEFVSAVRGAWMHKRFEELDRLGSKEPAA